METIFIIALLASNIWLISKIFKKPDNAAPHQNPQESAPQPTPPTEDTPAETAEGGQASVRRVIAGESHLDMAQFEELINRAVKKAVPIAITEYTRLSDVKFADEPEGAEKQIPDSAPATTTTNGNDLEKMFTHTTVGEMSGEVPEPDEPRTGGHGFKELETAVRVAKGAPHTSEEAKTAKVVLTDIQGTELGDRLTLDPNVRRRLFAIIYGDPDEPVNEETLANKKVVFSATIDTFNVDEINLNILS